MRIDKLLCLICAVSIGNVLASDTMLSVTNYVQVKDKHFAEARYYYQKNWLKLRQAAVAEGMIHSYRLTEIAPEEEVPFQLVLETVFRDQQQYDAAEKNFRRLIDRMQPNGPRLLNELKSKQFRKILYTSKKASTIGG
ncbi:hypothetical protein [Pleionea sp. CnH1-48]|uniref:hypothetical protein n=1 Tax=Pleionea sp. CnH1-48 TaxID=2954494 RepID=UPI0020975667|nr:hypothetical protein [Pleionea sp. CnH1-48]MCO7225807.1 hypothetical protein [Pleionea sp. CnH1-48]